jgi:hypothetical protein
VGQLKLYTSIRWISLLTGPGEPTNPWITSSPVEKFPAQQCVCGTRRFPTLSDTSFNERQIQ